MRTAPDKTPSKRSAVNLTIREDVLKEARELKLNASRAAEAGLVQAIREAREQQWLEANKPALAAHNQRVETDGTLLTPGWASE